MDMNFMVNIAKSKGITYELSAGMALMFYLALSWDAKVNSEFGAAIYFRMKRNKAVPFFYYF